MGRIAVAATLSVALSISATSPVLAWGEYGHRVVAAVAYNLLPEIKAKAIDKLLRAAELNKSFVDAAAHADEYIRDHDGLGQYAPWHYVNWRTKTPYEESYCRSSCVITALHDATLVVRQGKDREARAVAISWIMHLAGDLHQPLHVGDRGDFGGNGFKVGYRGQFLISSNKKMNLHSVWDSFLVEEIAGAKTPWQLGKELAAGLTTYKGHEADSGTFMDWIKQAHELAETSAYADLDEGEDIQQPYIDKAIPVIRRQLLSAGVRLAKILDENFL